MLLVLRLGNLTPFAYPTLFRSRTRAQNRAAQSDLRNALVAAKTMYTDTSSYLSADYSASGLITVEPAHTCVAFGTESMVTSPAVSVLSADTAVAAVGVSAPGAC